MAAASMDKLLEWKEALTKAARLSGWHLDNGRSRLWFHEDIAHVLTENMGTDEIEAIMLDFHEPEEMHLSAKAFKKMKRLRILIIRNALLTMAPVYLSNELRWLEWPGCPLLSLPSTFHARKLVVLNMQHSFISHFEGFKMPCLEKLRLSRTAIEVLPSSIKNISGLKVLTLTFCKNLADLPNSIYKLTHLECLLLEGCSKLDKFPVNGENEVPSNFLTSSNCYENSSGLDFLQANSLEGSSSLGFPSLRLLDLRNCCLRNVNFLKMHDCFPMLKELDLSGNSFAIFPETLSLFTHLKSLRLHKCKKLQEIPELPRNIKRLEARDCELLERYSPLEKEGEWPAKLRVVDFSNCHKLAKNQGKNLEDAFFSKVFHKQFQVEMFLPGSKIPEWFTVTGEQGSLTYLVPSSVFEKIQGLVICSILCLEDGVTANISCEMFVDGKSMILCSRHFFPLETDHMWLYYQPYCYTRALGKAINDLVRFEISFEVLGAPRGSALKMCGIYFIYTQDKTVSDPSSTQSTSYHTEHSVSFDLMTSHYVVDPGLALRRRMNRKRPVSSDLTERCLELSLNPKVSRRKIADDQRRKPFSLSLPSADQRRKRFSLSLPSADQRRKRFSLSLPSADQPASSDLTEGCYNVDLELRLNPKVSRRKTADDQKPGNPLTASKSGEHQLEHWLSLSLQPMDVSNWDPCSTQSTSYYTEHSVSFDLITSHYVVDPGLALSPSMNRKRPASSDLTEGCYNVDLELSLNPKVSRRKTADDQRGEQFSLSLQSANQKPGNPLTASKSGEHQLEHWLSLSLQPMDVSNRDPMCIKKLEEKVPFQPKCKEKMNFFNELGRILLPAEEGEEEEDGGSNSN
ncbi:hypothetical protein POTOM_058803 [Populus tomentosa]|uniref:PH domain-containing protein n=1 Tax=Populus tomentosa TaxID=118781 RepID=A0A8X8C2J4_POPTO|nr:hypothetical protein POTOM_058803 [Populus tomentosa]